MLLFCQRHIGPAGEMPAIKYIDWLARLGAASPI